MDSNGCSFYHEHGDENPLPAIDVVQNVYDDLGLSQVVSRSGSEWTRGYNETISLSFSHSDNYAESVVSTLTLVSADDPDADLHFSVSSTIAFAEVISVAGGRFGAGNAANSFEIIYDSGGPSAIEGMVVYIDSADDEAKLGINNSTLLLAEVAGVLTADYDAGDPAVVQTEGAVELADWTNIAGTAALVTGATYFLDATAGLMTVTPPSTGKVVIIGRAMTPTMLDIEINLPWIL